MDAYVKNITLDVNAEFTFTKVAVKQGDKILRELVITLTKDGILYTPSGVSQIWFRVQKPDGHYVIQTSNDEDSPIETISAGVYRVKLKQQCLTSAGKAFCDIMLLDTNENILSSVAFLMEVYPCPAGMEEIVSSDYFQILQDAIAKAQSLTLLLRVHNNILQYSTDGGITWHDLYELTAITNA